MAVIEVIQLICGVMLATYCLTALRVVIRNTKKKSAEDAEDAEDAENSN